MTNKKMPPPTDDEKYLARQAIALAKRKTMLAAGFAGFKAMVLPNDLPEDQLELAEVAFFAGAQYFLNCVVAVGRVNTPTKSKHALLRGVSDEINQFTNDYYMQNKEKFVTQH